MGLLDDAIREHLELKRRHGADPGEIAQLEREAFGPARRGPEPLEVPAAATPEAEAPVEPPVAADVHDDGAPAPVVEPVPDLPVEPAPEPEVAPEREPVDPLLIEPEVDAPAYEPEPTRPEPIPELPREPPARDAEAAAPDPDAPEGEDLLEETPEFLEETPEHDRLWFEQRPPRDFDFDG